METRDKALEWQEALPKPIRTVWDSVCKAVAAENFPLVPHGTRTLVNRVARDLAGATDYTSFAESVKALSQGGFISSRDEERLQVVVEAGNAVVHRELELTGDHARVLVHIVENLLRSAYFPQEAVDAVRKAIPPRLPSGKR